MEYTNRKLFFFPRVCVWMAIVNGYNVLATPATDPYNKKEYEKNAKAKHSILSGLIVIEFVKVMHYKFAKQTWDKLQKNL